MHRRVAFVLLIALAGCKQREAPREETGPAAAESSTAATGDAAAATLPGMVAPVDPPANARTSAALPAELTTLGERIAMCEHFAGEEPYDAERAKFLREQIEATCTGNAKALARLRQKYAGDAAAAKFLAGLEAPDM